MCFDPIVLFFLVGIIAKIYLPQLRLPKIVYECISIFLLISIGLKGGLELCHWASGQLALQVIGVLVLSVTTCFISLLVLNRFFHAYSYAENIVIAAHYGSVSVGTFAVALAILQDAGINYEAYMPLFVALMESPAIIIASLLLKREYHDAQSIYKSIAAALHCKSIYILFASLILGYGVGDYVLHIIEPIFFTPFKVVLAIFLFEMGILVGQQMGLIKKQARDIVMHSVVLSLICASIGFVFGIAMQLSLGGVILLMVLASSASYIAVPAAIKQSYPQANVPLALSHSLGATFTFNVFIGIYLYMYIAQKVFFYFDWSTPAVVCG